MAREIQLQVFASDAQVLLVQTNRDAQTEARAIRSLISQRVDAIVLLGTFSYGTVSNEELGAMLRGFHDNDGTVLSIGREVGVGSTIALEDVEAARELATALVVEGHRRFAVVGAMGTIPSAANRTGGFLAGLTEAGVEPELSVDVTLDRAGGHALAQKIAEHLEAEGGSGTASGDGTGRRVGDSSGPLCVFAPADIMALAALGELRRLGIEVPGHVAVAGYGGVPGSLDSNPPLTTVALPLREIAREAVSWVLSTADARLGGRARVPGEKADATSTDSASAARASVGDADVAGGNEGTSGIIRTLRGEVVLRESTALGG
jgi:LacI family transcriptional regulator